MRRAVINQYLARDVNAVVMFVFQSTNILQAILCLINELDRDALEVVDDAVRNRLDVSS